MNTVKFTSIIAILGIVVFINACNKNCQQKPLPTNEAITSNKVPAPVVQNNSISQVVTVADIRKSADGLSTRIIFTENEEIFNVSDASLIARLQDAYDNNKIISATFNPWSATVLNVSAPSDQDVNNHRSRQLSNAKGIAQKIDLSTMNPDVINNAPAMAVLDNTTTGLTDVIPDMATAQLMFDYITHQCCALSGPYLIDHCISFQYCEDGCYARAHKMCWILNNTYHYATHKIFSFANSGPDQLSVKCEKWRGCCVNWWYHVAPLVNIKTPTGVKAFVFDPAMFDVPVLLATWLHAQENPACSSTPHVSMINIQPTASYSPASMTGLVFDTDPTYSNTNSTLVAYSPLHTCY
jgi:hypothetical protein